jgi:hypothetical protein
MEQQPRTGGFGMTHLNSTTSSLAIIEAWSRGRQLRNIPADWAVRYFSDRTLYIRILSLAEREATEYDTSDSKVVWYGAFLHVDSSLVAVNDTLSSLFLDGKNNEALLLYVN